jgi:hypothetical protein
VIRVSFSVSAATVSCGFQMKLPSRVERPPCGKAAAIAPNPLDRSSGGTRLRPSSAPSRDGGTKVKNELGATQSATDWLSGAAAPVGATLDAPAHPGSRVSSIAEHAEKTSPDGTGPRTKAGSTAFRGTRSTRQHGPS